jgi:hypothetical protein
VSRKLCTLLLYLFFSTCTLRIATWNSTSTEALRELCGTSGEGLIYRSPLHALASTVACEDQQAVHLVTIQILDRVVQALFRIFVRQTGKRIVNTRWPAVLFEGSQDDFLSSRWASRSANTAR